MCPVFEAKRITWSASARRFWGGDSALTPLASFSRRFLITLKTLHAIAFLSASSMLKSRKGYSLATSGLSSSRALAAAASSGVVALNICALPTPFRSVRSDLAEEAAEVAERGSEAEVLAELSVPEERLGVDEVPSALEQEEDLEERLAPWAPTAAAAPAPDTRFL